MNRDDCENMIRKIDSCISKGVTTYGELDFVELRFMVEQFIKVYFDNPYFKDKIRKPRKVKTYALYINDMLITTGTMKELSECLGIQASTLRKYQSESYAKKVANYKRPSSKRKAKFICAIDEDEQ